MNNQNLNKKIFVEETLSIRTIYNSILDELEKITAEFNTEGIKNTFSELIKNPVALEKFNKIMDVIHSTKLDKLSEIFKSYFKTIKKFIEKHIIKGDNIFKSHKSEDIEFDFEAKDIALDNQNKEKQKKLVLAVDKVGNNFNKLEEIFSTELESLFNFDK